MSRAEGDTAAADRLIVALDVSSRAEAERAVERLGDAVLWYKIGHQLAFSDGLPLVRALSESGKKVFLDLKLLDIANTVEKGVESILKLGAAMTTVHAYPQAMRAAAAAARGSDLLVLGVTVLTSFDATDLEEAGYGTIDPAAMVRRRAIQAAACGIGGVVSSPQEAALVRAVLRPEMAIVTPGIRPAGAAAGDQKRVARPSEALRAGATHLVVGRPILGAADPAAAAAAVLGEIDAALGPNP